jgi:hypothetical protein
MRQGFGWLVVALAVLIGGSLARADDGPVPGGATTAKETGFTEAAAQAAIKKSLPEIEFTAPVTGDGRRRVFGTIAKARTPAIELLGAPDDLSQISAITPLMTPLGPASVETAPFAVAALDFAAADWAERRDWLRSALTKVAQSKEDHKVSETRGRFLITFAAWQKLGMFRVTVETAEGAAARAAALGGIPGTSDQTKPAVPTPPKADAGSTKGPAPRVEAQADGTTLVDGKYKLKGKGTETDPYKVTWDQLASAQDDYVPKDGRKEIPGRIAMLDDAWVETTGYIAFPIMSDQADECLSMMNQWDGCCIGIPPTPYDAVEVRLKAPAEGNARMATFGTIRGKFKVDPHLVGGWLVGLYRMEDATLSPQAFGGFAP